MLPFPSSACALENDQTSHRATRSEAFLKSRWYWGWNKPQDSMAWMLSVFQMSDQPVEGTFPDADRSTVSSTTASNVQTKFWLFFIIWRFLLSINISNNTNVASEYCIHMCRSLVSKPLVTETMWLHGICLFVLKSEWEAFSLMHSNFQSYEILLHTH